MLKKSLIAIAVLAIALPAVAGEIKVHTPWPVSFVKQTITVIDVIMDVGFFIHVKDQDPIKVHQDTTAENPFKTYVGCRTSDVISNFEAKISGKGTSKSPAGGDWSAKFNGESNLVIPVGTTVVDICVTGKKVNIDKLQGGAREVKVAEIKIQVVPA